MFDVDRMSKLERDYEELKRCLSGAVAVDSGGYFDGRSHEGLMRRVRLCNEMFYAMDFVTVANEALICRLRIILTSITS